MILAWPSKDPDEVLDYKIDWSDRLDGDVISSSVFTFEETDGNLTIDSKANDDTSTTVWLSGGVQGNSKVGRLHLLTNRITTTSGRTMDQTVKIRIVSK